MELAARDDLAGAAPYLRAAARQEQALRVPALLSLGALLTGHGRIPEAIRVLRRGLRIAPGMPALHTSLAQPLLASGDYAAGWPEYEWRRHVANFPRLPGPEWRGEPIEGSTILVHTEQGFGDCLMLARYLPLLAQRAGHVMLACDRPLIPLLRDVTGLASLVELPDPAFPHYDRWVLTGSLPLLFSTTLDSIPSPGGYLKAPPARAAAWAQLLPAGPKIGLAWSGNPALTGDDRRSISFQTLVPLLDTPGITFISLQVGPRRDELAGHPSVIDLGGKLIDFAETAAVIANLDIVIAVHTAVANLSGALGAATWVMLPHVPDWRWMLSGDNTPWYASARLFRQKRAGDWDAVVARIAVALRKFANEP